MKRLLALLLCLCLCVSLIPAAAAEDIEIVEVETETEEEPEPVGEEGLIEIIDPEEPTDPTGETPNAKPTITTQPEDLTICAGEGMSLSVTATGATAYQWYWRNDSSDSEWKTCSASSATTATLKYSKISADKSGHQYRCKVSNSSGYVYTKTVTLTVATEKPTITVQPTNLAICAGEGMSLSVTAYGATAYQWYWRNDSSDDWKTCSASSATTATLSYSKISADKSGHQYRCKVSNSFGYVYSKVVTLTVTAKPVITSQPANKTAALGATAKFTVKATGADSYQWYYRTSSSGSWAKSTVSSAKSATLSIVAEKKRDGYQYRCKVSNADGYVYSSAATLTIASKPTITTQPLSYVTGGEPTITFKVKATGAESYQWYYRKYSGDSWKTSSLSGCRTASLKVKATEARNGYQYCC